MFDVLYSFRGRPPDLSCNGIGPGLVQHWVLVLSYCEDNPSSAVQECAPFSPSTSITVYGTAYQCNAQISDLIASCGIDSCFLPGDDGHPRKSYQGWGFDVIPMYPLAAFNSRFPGFGIYSLSVPSLLFFGELSAFTPSTPDHLITVMTSDLSFLRVRHRIHKPNDWFLLQISQTRLLL